MCVGHVDFIVCLVFFHVRYPKRMLFLLEYGLYMKRPKTTIIQKENILSLNCHLLACSVKDIAGIAVIY